MNQISFHVPLNQQIVDKVLFDCKLEKAYSVNNILFKEIDKAINWAQNHSKDLSIKTWYLKNIPIFDNMVDIIENEPITL
jgi:hypothetical protein